MILSTDRIRVYQKNKTIVIAVRGTDKTNADDLKDDLAIVRGTLHNSPRFLQLKKVYEGIVKEFPDYQIILTGHSLGGGMIIELSKYHNDFKGYLFNPAVNINNLRSKEYNLKNIETHLMEHDPLIMTSSFLPNVSKYKFPYPKNATINVHLKAHSLESFLGR